MSQIFEDAVRKMFDAPPEARVSVFIEGGQDVQIGDYTWDTEPHEIEVWAVWGDPPNETRREEKWYSIPELFEALMKAEIKT